MKKKQKEKRIAMALATGLIISNFPANLTYAQTNAIDKLNSELEINIKDDTNNSVLMSEATVEENTRETGDLQESITISPNEVNVIDESNVKEDTKSENNILSNNVVGNKATVQEVARITLKDGKEIRAVKDDNYIVTLEEFDTTTNQWINKCEIGEVEVKEMKATDNGGYTVTYLDYVRYDSFKYRQAYDVDSNTVGSEEIVGIEIKKVDDDGNYAGTLPLDLIVDKNTNTTIIKSKLGDVVVKDFVPVLCAYIGSNHIAIIGEDSKGLTSNLIVTGSGKVINSDIIKDANYFSSEYTNIKVLGISQADGENFIVSGYVEKATDPGKKDGFLMQFDENGYKSSEVKIIPSSYGENNDASVNVVVKFDSGNLRIQGTNLDPMYINSLTYSDTRPVKESLKLLNGQIYKVVEETSSSRTGSSSTFTVKSVGGIFEYDIATYTDVKDINLVPGNNNQVLIAVSNIDNSTEIGIINTDDDADVNYNGEVVSKVVNVGKIQDATGTVYDIDIQNIKVNSNGNLTITINNSSAPIDINVSNVESGTPIEIIEEEQGTIIPSIEEQMLVFDRKNPQDVVIENVDLKGLTLKRIGIGGENIDINEVTLTNNSIIISKDAINRLKLDNGIKAVALEFSNYSLFVGVVNINIIDSSIENNPDVNITPTIGQQRLTFDKNNLKDVVINNVDFKETKLKSISIAGQNIDVNKLSINSDSILIPKLILLNLPISNGEHPINVEFEDGTSSTSDVTLDITGSINATIKEQVIDFNINNPQDIVIQNVDLKGLELKYIYINGSSISSNSFKVEGNEIVIPVNVLKSLSILNGVYDISFKLLNGTSILSKVYLNVIDTTVEETPEVKPEEKPPIVEEEKPSVETNQIVNVDNGEKVIFDINKPTNIKIVSSKLENKEVAYILVNGIKVTKTAIEGKVYRTALERANKEYFIVSNGAIILTTQLFEDLNLDTKDGYNIGVGFADGSKIDDLAKLNIVNGSINIDDIVVPPVSDNENNIITDTATPPAENNENNSLPSTGAPIGSGVVSVFGMLSAFVGSILFKKKNNYKK